MTSATSSSPRALTHSCGVEGPQVVGQHADGQARRPRVAHQRERLRPQQRVASSLVHGRHEETGVPGASDDLPELLTSPRPVTALGQPSGQHILPFRIPLGRKRPGPAELSGGEAEPAPRSPRPARTVSAGPARRSQRSARAAARSALRLVDDRVVEPDDVARPRAVRAPGQEDTFVGRPRFGGQPAVQGLPAHRAEPGAVQQMPLGVAARTTRPRSGSRCGSAGSNGRSATGGRLLPGRRSIPVQGQQLIADGGVPH